MALFLMILIGNEYRRKTKIHIEILSITENSIQFKAVSPINQGLPFGSRLIVEDLEYLTAGNYRLRVLDEATISERILARYIHAESAD